MKLDSDDFELFGVPRRFEQDRAALDTRWRALQTEVHPDRFVSEGAASQRVAMQWAVRVNEAYQRLKDPLRRAAYLCELNGAPIQAENNTAMPAKFLIQQMEWRESLDEADGVEAVEALNGEVAGHRQQALGQLKALLDDQHDFLQAAQQVRALMFVERFLADIDRRLEQLGQ
ncbi:Fe-S protein assembly co-chaperone HscB [Rhizobacter sp. Root1221]|uniref:Fe-S protein assembly co-chaperone HscB n=1 Tax=Rhizobacter sp. Root1221 TaxID=1736433 RepID=UPI0006FC29D4|nr:Fe-S protein assembly co-chaperone HscB [Rhizobacter sp. Root1221]KQV78342.1 co-chaperone HscB [Rhizobacter sp. Root1221]